MSYCEYYQEENLLVLAKYNGLVEMYEEGEIVATYSLPVDYINKIAVSQTRRQLFIFSGENNISVVDLLSGENIADISTSSQANTINIFTG